MAGRMNIRDENTEGLEVVFGERVIGDDATGWLTRDIAKIAATSFILSKVFRPSVQVSEANV
jgi:hypothetical protein